MVGGETVWDERLDEEWYVSCLFFFFSSRRRHTRFTSDWSSDVCSSDLSLVIPLRCTNPESVIFVNWRLSVSRLVIPLTCTDRKSVV